MTEVRVGMAWHLSDVFSKKWSPDFSAEQRDRAKGWVNGSGWLGWGQWAGKTGWARPIPGPTPAVRWPVSKPHKRVPVPISFSAHLSLRSPQTSMDQGSLPQNLSELLKREILITSVQRNSGQLWHQLWV